MACAFCYYGLVLMSTEIFGGTGPINVEIAADGSSESTDCRPLQTTDYMDLLWTTLAEFPGIFATIFIIEKCGRKKTMAFQFLLYAGCVIMLTATTEYVFAAQILDLLELIVTFPFSFQSNNVDNNFIHGAWCHCRPLPSGLRIHAGSVSDCIAIGWRWWVFGSGTFGRHGHTVRGAGAAANIGHECGHRLWYFGSVCQYSMPSAAVRDKRHRHGRIDAIRSTKLTTCGFHYT